jgi:hypothetical protein
VFNGLLACQQAAIAADETLSEAKQQLDSHQAKDAYTLLAHCNRSARAIRNMTTC